MTPGIYKVFSENELSQKDGANALEVGNTGISCLLQTEGARGWGGAQRSFI